MGRGGEVVEARFEGDGGKGDGEGSGGGEAFEGAFGGVGCGCETGFHAGCGVNGLGYSY